MLVFDIIKSNKYLSILVVFVALIEPVAFLLNGSSDVSQALFYFGLSLVVIISLSFLLFAFILGIVNYVEGFQKLENCNKELLNLSFVIFNLFSVATILGGKSLVAMITGYQLF